MALQPPSPQTNVPRSDVSNVVDAMLLDSRVKWVGIIYEATVVSTSSLSRHTLSIQRKGR